MDAKWFFNRLFSMSPLEIIWRVQQKVLETKELIIFGTKKRKVTDYVFNQKHANSILHGEKLIVDSLIDGSVTSEINTNTDWHSGIQTLNTWPCVFSYKLKYKQRDDIGDARSNWEINRHFQFVDLAKNYYLTKDTSYLNKLIFLFDNWNESNFFLWGISWTSPMEIAIRLSNWCYTYVLIYGTSSSQDLCERLRIGILNMADYIKRHYSRFSSANNHTIVEMYALILVGILFNIEAFTNKGLKILTSEIEKQNYPDGVNKEQSLHYHAFVMEALSLSILLLKKNGINYSPVLETQLNRMTNYLIDCLGEHGEILEFGDNDEGRILYLNHEKNYYQYVLSLVSKSHKKSLKYRASEFVQYKDGGVTLFRSNDRRILIGIDHGPLGFGSIAAHGHADALSFQLYYDGIGFFVDPGTYIYHIQREKRDCYRSSINHNTVCIEGKNQSEIKGSFLWGRRANAKMESVSENLQTVVTSHDGYGFDIFRTYSFNFKDELRIEDQVGKRKASAVFIVGPECSVSQENSKWYVTYGLKRIELSFEGINVTGVVEQRFCSSHYGCETWTKAIVVSFEQELKTRILIC